MIKFSNSHTHSFDYQVAAEAFAKFKDAEMAGWLTVPVDNEELSRIKKSAEKIKSDSEYLVCIGIGGSYLGHRAVIEALRPKNGVKVLYAGNSLNTTELNIILDAIKDHDFSINVISKSGTTTEPAVAFRLLKKILVEKYGEEEAYGRIYATTDKAKGALFSEADTNGYARFVVPDNIGGRYSVLTAVGLLPLAASGVDIDKLLESAQSYSAEIIGSDLEFPEKGSAAESVLDYAMTRQSLYKNGIETEILATFHPRMQMFEEWWKQLYGESEGKENKGIYPASVVYTTDLHSMGQYLQQGRRNIFETMLKIENIPDDQAITIEATEDNLDGLNFLAGKTLQEVNKVAEAATIAAHREGNIEVLELTMDALNEENMGQLIWFFEFACAISATINGIDPFNQPGVETYKTNMFRLLGKPGYEK